MTSGNCSIVPADAPADSCETDGSVAAAVVVIVFVVIIITVAVAIFILYRQNRLHLWRTCFRHGGHENAPRTETSQSTAQTLGRGDIGTSGRTVTTTAGERDENQHGYTTLESQSSDNYYSIIKNQNGMGGPSGCHNSTIHDFHTADNEQLPSTSKLEADDPYEIKTDGKNAPLKCATATKSNPGRVGNYLAPVTDKDGSHSAADYSLATAMGDETTGVYHILEEDPYSKGEEGATASYHYAKDTGSLEATGVYHILEEESSGSQPVSVYHLRKGEQQIQNVKASKGPAGNYNTLDFAGKSAGGKKNGDDSGGVYNHLNEGSADTYNEVHREKRRAVIDGEYSHIK